MKVTVRFYSEKSQTLLKSPMTSQRALTWTLTASWNTLKKLQGAIRKSHFPAINQHIPYSLCSHVKSAYSTCHLTNRHLCCLATSCLLEQGVNSGNRITQHVKNELGTTVHVRRNYSAYPWILVLNGWLEGIFFYDEFFKGCLAGWAILHTWNLSTSRSDVCFSGFNT